MGLSSVVAAVTFGVLALKANAGFAAPATKLAWIAFVLALYIVLQLVCAIMAAVRGQALVSETHVRLRRPSATTGRG